MKQYFILLGLIVLSFFCMSCEKEDFSTTVEVDLSEYGEQMVVLAPFKPDYGNNQWGRFYLMLVKSNDILDESRNFERIKNAEVSLYQGKNFLLHLEHWKNGIYLAPHNTGIVADRAYELKISHDDLGTVTAQSYTPKQVNVLQAFVSNHSYYDELEDREMIEITLEIADEPNVDNYYFLLVQTFAEVNSRIYNRHVLFDSNDPIFDEDKIDRELFGIEIEPGSGGVTEDLLGFDIETLLSQQRRQDQTKTFQDASFDGENRQIQIYIKKSDLEAPVYDSDLDEWFPASFDISLIIGSMSRELYLYKRSAKEQEWSGENPFAEPIPAFNNIEGGMGVFGGFVEDTILVER